jgi:hypothetical protein
MKKLIIISLIVLFSTNANAAPKVGKMNPYKPTLAQKNLCSKEFDTLDQSDQIQCLKMMLQITSTNLTADMHNIYNRLEDAGI